MAFLNWVAYSKELSPASPEDHLRCPMFNCRQGGFKSMELFLNHVFNCEWLPEAVYWCPYHRRQEPFGVSELQGGCFTSHETPKDSKLKKAFDFFKRFGRIGHKHGFVFEKPHRTPSEKSELETIYPKPNELDDTGSLSIEQFLATQTRDEKTRGQSATHELRVSTQTLGPYEMGASDWRPRAHQRCELPGSSRNAMGHSTNLISTILDREVPQNDTLVSPISPTSASSGNASSPPMVSPMSSPVVMIDINQRYVTGNRWSSSTQYSVEDVRDGGVSQDGFQRTTTEPSDTYTSRATPSQTQVPVNPQPSCLEAAGCSSLGHRKSVASSALKTAKNGSSTRVQASASPLIQRQAVDSFHSLCQNNQDYVLGAKRQDSTQILVENLRQLVCMLNDRWQASLVDWPELSSLAFELETSSPFDDGLRSLKTCLNGALPTTLPDVFALMHLGYACAYMCYSDQACYSWNVFYQDVLRWGKAISEKQDRYRFALLADLLWSVPKQAFESFESSGMPSTSRRRNAASLRMDPYCTSPSQGNNSELNVGVAPTLDFQATLRSGVLIECCTHFLDDFAYANILERLASHSHNGDLHQGITERSMSLVESMIEPLLQRPENKDFQLPIEETWRALCLEQLCSIREVEVMLTADGQGRFRGFKDHKRYCEAVASLCDDAVQSPNPGWRTPYQVHHIDHVQVISMQLEGSERAAGEPHICQEMSGESTTYWESKVRQEGLHQCTQQRGVKYCKESQQSEPCHVHEHEHQSTSARIILSCLTSAGYPSCDSAGFTPTKTPSSATSNESSNSFTSCSSWASAGTAASSISSASQYNVSCNENIESMAPRLPSSPPDRSLSFSAMGPPPSNLPPPKRSVTRCHLCNQPFKGDHQNRASNVRRHLKTVHHQGQLLTCGEPGCSKVCGRADNLRKHRLSAHNIQDPIRRPISSKRSRRPT